MKLGSILPAVAAAAAGLVIAFAGPAGATTVSGGNVDVPLPFDVGSGAPCITGDLVFVTANSHLHMFGNNNGFWVNGTIEGTVINSADPSDSGHGEAWIGVEFNRGANVNHMKVSADLPSGRVMLTDQVTVNENGVMTVSHATASCG